MNKRTTMTRAAAWGIVRRYDSIVAVSGQAYADKHFLAVGTSREATNRALLEEARQIVSQKREADNGQS